MENLIVSFTDKRGRLFRLCHVSIIEGTNKKKALGRLLKVNKFCKKRIRP